MTYVCTEVHVIERRQHRVDDGVREVGHDMPLCDSSVSGVACPQVSHEQLYQSAQPRRVMVSRQKLECRYVAVHHETTVQEWCWLLRSVMHYGARAVEMLDTAVVRVTAVNECCCLHFHVKGRKKWKHPKCLYKATNLLTGQRCQPTVTLLSQHQAQHLV